VADGGKGLRELATGVGRGVATAAGAIAAIVGVLHQFGYLSGPAPRPAAIVSAIAPQAPAVLAAPQPVSVAAAPAASSTAGRTRPERAAIAKPGTHERAHAEHVAPGEPAAAESEPPPQALAMAPQAKPQPMPRPADLPERAPTAPVQTAALSGAWRDHGAGYCHVIKQTGAAIEIVNLAPVTSTFISVGHGRIDGREVRLHLNDLHPHAAQAELYLSEDAQILMGTIKRPDGDYPVRWYRSGTSCTSD